MAKQNSSYWLHRQTLATIVLALAFTCACGKSKPEVIAHCVAVSLTAAEAASGVAETMTSCVRTPAACEKLKSGLAAGTAGKCAPTAKLWCSGSEYCAPTIKRCELNQENLNRTAEANETERTSLSCRPAHSLPEFTVESAPPPSAP